MALLDALKKRIAKKARIHSGSSQFASLSLASATLSSPLNQATSGSSWQKKAWEFYDVVPEMRLVVSYRSAALSKVKLQIARMTPEGPDIVTDERTQQVLEMLFGGVAHHSSALARYAQHLTIAGETYTFVINNDGEDEWLIVPPDQTDFDRSSIRFKHPLTGDYVSYPLDAKNFYNYRLWIPHPHNFWEADSPTRGGISSLDKIMHIDAAIKTMAKSRLIGSGILPLPVEANLPTPTGTNEGLTPEDAFKRDIHETMSAAIRDGDSPARHAPIMLWMPAEAIKSLPERPISFWSEFDDNASDLRDTEIRRYAAGQPLPTEMITGVGDVNHWTGWHLSEEDLKFDIAPLAQIICDALTIRVVQPLLGDGWVVVPEFSALVTRPNRTPEAINLFTAGAITRDELREAAGYSAASNAVEETDNPTVPLIKVSSDRNNPPPELDSAKDEGSFAVAELLARDLLYTAGQWMLTHSGRDARGKLSTVGVMERHTVFRADVSVIEEAICRVKPKYEDVVDPGLFKSVVQYVDHIFVNSSGYCVDDLRAWVADGH